MVEENASQPSPVIPNDFSLVDESSRLRFSKIHRDFAGTEHGEVLAGQIRYSRYKPESISNEEWIDLLGRDVQNLQHMPLTYGLARQFLRHSKYFAEHDGEVEDTSEYSFTRREEEDLLLAAIWHDQAESIVGDYMVDQKQDDHEAEEIKAMGEIIKKYYGEIEGLADRLKHIKDEIVFNRETRLGKVFNMIERVGYLRTGLRAFEKSQEVDDPELRQGLQWLSNNVLLNQVNALLDYAHENPAVREFLVANRDRITAAFEHLPENLFDLYREDEIEDNKGKYHSAKERWFQSRPKNIKNAEVIQFPLSPDDEPGSGKQSA